MLTIDDKGGRRGLKIPKNSLRNTWMFPKQIQVFMYPDSYSLDCQKLFNHIFLTIQMVDKAKNMMFDATYSKGMSRFMTFGF